MNRARGTSFSRRHFWSRACCSGGPSFVRGESPRVPRSWSIVLYLFLATLPCDILGAYLVFSERVAYPVYLSMPRHSALSVLDDQQLAGALMWTVVTIVYLVAGGILSARLLSPQSDTDPRGVEVA